jgi:hypothetical protein
MESIMSNKIISSFRFKHHLLTLGIGLGFAVASQGAFAACTYNIESEWSTGFTANITIKNDTGSAVNNWNVNWQYANNRMSSGWNATFSGTNPYTASNLNWNGNIAAGQTVSFGIQGTKNGNTAERPAVTGSVCGSSTVSSTVSSAVSSSRSSSSALVSSSRSSSSSSTSLVVNSSSRSSTAAQASLLIQESQAGFCRVDGTIDTNNTGYTGNGFANTNNAQGAAVVWAVEAPSSSRHTLTFRFANGGTTNRNGSLVINGGSNGNYTLSLPATGSWTNWQTASIEVDLVQGNNLLQLSSLNVEGLPNIDSLSVAGSNAKPGNCGANSSSSSSSTSSFVAPTSFDNPIIKYDAADPTKGPGNYIYTADATGLVWNDRVYLYTGHDEQAIGVSGYRMFDYRLWSSTDMVNWKNHGAILRYNNFSWARGGTSTGNANAGHVVHRTDSTGKSKFYFYAPLEGGQSAYGISIGVAVSDYPEGPFTDPRGMPLVLLADTTGFADHSWRNLDPAVFIDDDGRAYLYWGNGRLFWVELEPDMIHIKGETYSLNSQGKMQNRSISGVKINTIDNLPSYTEAPFVSKHGGLYYLSYASGFPETIAYATSSSPRGPWQYRNQILDLIQGTGTSHQSIFDFRGATFMSYHTAALPNGGDYRRSVSVDRVYFNSDGSIKKVIPTKK